MIKIQTKKYRVFTALPIFAIVLLLLGIGGFSLFFLDFELYNNSSTFYTLLFFLVIFPLVLFIWSFITMWPCLSFDEKGITKTLLGKKLKYIEWKEIVEIKRFRQGFAIWLFISKVPLKNYSISRCRLRRDNVFIVETEEIINIIQKHTSDYVNYEL